MHADGSSTSFLDVMACALGGMAMLFLILSVLPHFGEPLNAESNEGAESVIPLSAPTREGRAGIATPVMMMVSHPYCKVDTGADLYDADEVAGAVWSALDETESGMRRGILRLAPNGNSKITFYDCRNSGGISMEYIFHPILTGVIERFNQQREFRYRDGRLR